MPSIDSRRLSMTTGEPAWMITPLSRLPPSRIWMSAVVLLTMSPEMMAPRALLALAAGSPIWMPILHELTAAGCTRAPLRPTYRTPKLAPPEAHFIWVAIMSTPPTTQMPLDVLLIGAIVPPMNRQVVPTSRWAAHLPAVKGASQHSSNDHWEAVPAMLSYSNRTVSSADLSGFSAVTRVKMMSNTVRRPWI